MTPAVDVLNAAGVDYKLCSYKHDRASESYGLEAATKLGVSPERVFKTLIVESGKVVCMGLVPVCTKLNLKHIAKASGEKKMFMVDPSRAEKVTGYVVGGVSPLGQRRILPAFLDISSTLFETIFVSAGKRGLDIEIEAGDLQVLLGAKVCHLI